MDPFAPARAALASLPGEAGAFASDSDGRAIFCEREDELFPSASVIKLPLVMTLYADAARGLVDLDERVSIGERVDGTGVLRHVREVERLSLRGLATLAIIVSDNTATNRLIERIGVDRVGDRMREWGCPLSRLSRKMYDFEAAKRGSENVMTARETVSLLLRLQRGECEDRATSDAVVALLEQCQDRTMLLRYVPYATNAPHKTGTLRGVVNDAGVLLEDAPHVVASARSQRRQRGTWPHWAQITIVAVPRRFR